MAAERVWTPFCPEAAKPHADIVSHLDKHCGHCAIRNPGYSASASTVSRNSIDLTLDSDVPCPAPLSDPPEAASSASAHQAFSRPPWPPQHGLANHYRQQTFKNKTPRLADASSSIVSNRIISLNSKKHRNQDSESGSTIGTAGRRKPGPQPQVDKVFSVKVEVSTIGVKIVQSGSDHNGTETFHYDNDLVHVDVWIDTLCESAWMNRDMLFEDTLLRFVLARSPKRSGLNLHDIATQPGVLDVYFASGLDSETNQPQRFTDAALDDSLSLTEILQAFGPSRHSQRRVKIVIEKEKLGNKQKQKHGLSSPSIARPTKRSRLAVSPGLSQFNDNSDVEFDPQAACLLQDSAQSASEIFGDLPDVDNLLTTPARQPLAETSNNAIQAAETACVNEHSHDEAVNSETDKGVIMTRARSKRVVSR